MLLIINSLWSLKCLWLSGHPPTSRLDKLIEGNLIPIYSTFKEFWGTLFIPELNQIAAALQVDICLSMLRSEVLGHLWLEEFLNQQKRSAYLPKCNSDILAVVNQILNHHTITDGTQTCKGPISADTIINENLSVPVTFYFP